MTQRQEVIRKVRREILAQTRTAGFKEFLGRTLMELCEVDTTPKADVKQMKRAEAACFKILERELRELNHSGGQVERRRIDPGIKSHANFSHLHFTKTAALPDGLKPEVAYAGRSNLVYIIRGRGTSGGRSVALNAHVDVVAPFIVPVRRGGKVFGRGACDDKGPVVGILGALKVLSGVMAKTRMSWNRNLVVMFVVEEETGGNGSLSLATDYELKGLYDSVLVSECTGLKIHPANRGAVWYRAEIRPPRGVSSFEVFSFVNEEMEKEGAAIRAESRHELFPQRPVQTCHGILGPYGEHPSRICGRVCFIIRFGKLPNQRTKERVEDCLASGLANYTGAYGDKTQVKDEATGKAMVARHYDLRWGKSELEVEVHGAAGHMGSIRERDGAITKAACLARSVILSRTKLEEQAGRITLDLVGKEESTETLVAEGGQGFVPTHPIEEVMGRLRAASERGAENYLRRLGRRECGADFVAVTYEKLHNVAFDGDPKSSTMLTALEAAQAVDIWEEGPVLGWTVSCDARLFATEYPGMPVLTFGPGRLMHAHSDAEQIELDEIRAASEFLAMFVLLETGTIERSKEAK